MSPKHMDVSSYKTRSNLTKPRVITWSHRDDKGKQYSTSPLVPCLTLARLERGEEKSTTAVLENWQFFKRVQ